MLRRLLMLFAIAIRSRRKPVTPEERLRRAGLAPEYFGATSARKSGPKSKV